MLQIPIYMQIQKQSNAKIFAGLDKEEGGEDEFKYWHLLFCPL